MLTKAYSSMVLAVDVAVAIARFVLIILESLFRLVVPVTQKSVTNEVVLVSRSLHIMLFCIIIYDNALCRLPAPVKESERSWRCS
jgi:hypothetical protein